MEFRNPTADELQTRIARLKSAYSVACRDVLADRPNACQHAAIALRRLNQARQQLAEITDASH